MDLSPPDPLHALLQDVASAADSAAALTRQLLAFSRKQVIDPRVLDLNEVIARLQKMLQRLLGEDIELVARLDHDLGPIRIDPALSEQVLINLCVNARDAMPDGGTLTLETRNVALDEEYCRRHAAVEPGDYVMCAVSDNGCGMTDEVKSHLFEPFFTTKEKGKGTGLGLAMVYGTVRQHQGAVEVYSELGRGTTVKIYLPRVAEAPEALPTRTERLLARGDERIVVVEDEAQVRELATRLLKKQGYRVTSFANGGEALLALEQDPERIDLLVTDVVMPGMNGLALAQKLAAARPDLRVLFTSGYTEDVIVRHGILDKSIQFLPKPYTLASLATRVREVLDAPAAPVPGPRP